MVSTGVPELDSLLGKGFPDRSAILVKGAVGSGKESLAYRFEMAGLARGDYCLFITHRSVRDILDDANGSGIDLEPSALVWVASQGSPTKYDPDDLATLSYNLKELLKDSSNNHIIVVVDALSPLLMLYQPETIYKFLRQLLEDAKKHDSVILATFDKGMHKPEVEISMEQLFDGVLEFSESHETTLLRVEKMRGLQERPTMKWGRTGSRAGPSYGVAGSQGGDRRLAAIMFTDMVGYTALGQRNETLSLAMVEELRKLVRPILARHGGREIKTMGDAFLVEFQSALEATRCAYDIQRAIREFNLSLAADSRLHLRIGIHLGDVVESGNDISGDAVNVASRIESLAQDGGVCLTSQTYESVQNKIEVPLESIGKRQLKNVMEPMEVYRMVMPWEKGSEASAPASSKRIAVLPFVSVSPDPNDEYFADGLTEEIITALSQLSDLQVIARSSVMTYKGKSSPISDVGRELRVGSVLEGSVRKYGDKIRIAAQLIDVSSDAHVWASNYDRRLDDIFVIQEDVASRIAEVLRIRLLPSEMSKLERLHSSSVEAYVDYIKASQLSHDRTEHNLREAIALYEEALTKDRNFVRAYAGLAQTWLTLGLHYGEPAYAYSKAEAAAKKALDLGPDSAVSHAAMARVYSYRDQIYDAKSEALEAIRIDPSLSEAHVVIALHNAILGNLEESQRAFERAHVLDPLYFNTFHPIVAQLAGNEKESLGILDDWRRIYPRDITALADFAEFYLIKAEHGKAQDFLDQALKVEPSETFTLGLQGLLFALTGNVEKAKETMKVLKSNPSLVWENATRYVATYVALGDLNSAFEELFRQAENKHWTTLMMSHPFYASMRMDPRFFEFCERVGIPSGK